MLDNNKDDMENFDEKQTFQEEYPADKPKKRLTVFGAEFVYLAFIGICVAFIGWVLENLVKLVTNGTIDARYHILPFISPYMLVPFAFRICFGDIDDLTVFGKKVFKKTSWQTKVLSNLLIYILLCLSVFLGELTVGNLCEICFGVSLWHYSSHKQLLVTSYAGLIPSLWYGTFAYLLFRFLYTPLLKGLKKASYKAIKITVIALGSLILLDAAHLIVHIFVFGKAPMLWKVQLR